MTWQDKLYLVGQGLLWLGVVGAVGLVAWLLGYLKK